MRTITWPHWNQLRDQGYPQEYFKEQQQDERQHQEHSYFMLLANYVFCKDIYKVDMQAHCFSEDVAKF